MSVGVQIVHANIHCWLTISAFSADAKEQMSSGGIQDQNENRCSRICLTFTESLPLLIGGPKTHGLAHGTKSASI